MDQKAKEKMLKNIPHGKSGATDRHQIRQFLIRARRRVVEWTSPRGTAALTGSASASP